MRILLIVEHNGTQLRTASRCALGFAHQLAAQSDGSVTCLLLGSGLDETAADAARYANVLVADDEALRDPVADRYARVIADVAAQHGFDLVTAAATTFAKDIVARAGGLLGGAMASEVIAHQWRDGRLLLQRPMYAGAVNATVVLHGAVQIVTVRPSAYEEAAAKDRPGSIEKIEIGSAALRNHIQFEGLASKETGRPDVTEARVVVSGGRAIKNSEDFERLIGALADRLGAATGSSRALVDAGITPNEFQVGQTGKIVAPDLYIAVGISGAIQHLAGMKDSKVIVAINKDEEAPIFQVADYGIVGDLFKVLPELKSEIEKTSSK
ncbi:MAG: electron transfer flavoprotein subunit alpha/FixB family protein [Planctomycetes bacterium]|nr:electron transfer flavoprotein subunit alpha/FixB family protein [Planctomycetota bacterium]